VIVRHAYSTGPATPWRRVTLRVQHRDPGILVVRAALNNECIVGGAARAVHVFTTVSEITAYEAERFLVSACAHVFRRVTFRLTYTADAQEHKCVSTSQFCRAVRSMRSTRTVSASSCTSVGPRGPPTVGAGCAQRRHPPVTGG